MILRGFLPSCESDQLVCGSANCESRDSAPTQSGSTCMMMLGKSAAKESRRSLPRKNVFGASTSCRAFGDVDDTQSRRDDST